MEINKARQRAGDQHYRGLPPAAGCSLVAHCRPVLSHLTSPRSPELTSVAPDCTVISSRGYPTEEWMALGCGKRLKILHHLFLLGSLGYPWLVSVLVFKGWRGGGVISGTCLQTYTSLSINKKREKKIVMLFRERVCVCVFIPQSKCRHGWPTVVEH